MLVPNTHSPAHCLPGCPQADYSSKAILLTVIIASISLPFYPLLLPISQVPKSRYLRFCGNIAPSGPWIMAKEHLPGPFPNNTVTFIFRALGVASETLKQEKKIFWRTVAVCVFILLPRAHNCQEARGLLPSALIAVKARGLLPRPQHCLEHFL